MNSDGQKTYDDVVIVSGSVRETSNMRIFIWQE